MSDWMPEAGAPPVSTPEKPVTGEPVTGEPELPPDGPVTDAPSFEPAAPAPLGVVRTPTGHAAVDARLERLADADHLPADGHIEVYEDVHRGLRSELTSLDDRPAAVPGPVPTPSQNTQNTQHVQNTHHTHHDNRS
ncbi:MULTISPECIES: hypothetical protein [unclassified Streptomyces]|uniref:hypothetical protein n=1 Tax=unclassified Streptomyces TaxID=2593676 RepID=UPI0037915A4B